MDKIINILLLIIIFVFDPLAISLVIAANFAFNKAYPKKKYVKNLYGEEVEDDSISVWDTTIEDGLEDIEVKDAEEINTKAEFMENLDKIEEIKKKQKNILDLNEDGIIDEDEIQAAKKMIQDLESQLKPGLSSFRSNKIIGEINQIKSSLPDEDDETKTY